MSKHKSPVQSSIEMLEAEGLTVDICERRITSRIKKDLFGFADLIAFNHNQTVLVQVTTASNLAARVKKILASRRARRWVDSPERYVEVHGWREYKSPDESGRTWRPIVREIHPHSFKE